MRIAIQFVTSLAMAVGPAFASEAFVAQPTRKAASVEQAATSSAKTMQAAMLALPLQPQSVNAPATPAANAATNASSVLQIGANNVASVTQTGGGNASAIIQRGNGNQANVTQRR